MQRTFTEVGFATVPIPDALWASIATYYRNNRHNHFAEALAAHPGGT